MVLLSQPKGEGVSWKQKSKVFKPLLAHWVWGLQLNPQSWLYKALWLYLSDYLITASSQIEFMQQISRYQLILSTKTRWAGQFKYWLHCKLGGFNSNCYDENYYTSLERTFTLHQQWTSPFNKKVQMGNFIFCTDTLTQMNKFCSNYLSQHLFKWRLNEFLTPESW